VQLSDYRGRRDLVLCFVGRDLHGAASDLLKSLSTRKDELEYEDTQVLVIVAGSLSAVEFLRARDGLAFPVLADADGAVHDRYAANLVITDRYGEIYSVHRSTWPTADEVMASLRHINAECPE
jgi:peroxiredoxin